MLKFQVLLWDSWICCRGSIGDPMHLISFSLFWKTIASVRAPIIVIQGYLLRVFVPLMLNSLILSGINGEGIKDPALSSGCVNALASD